MFEGCRMLLCSSAAACCYIRVPPCATPSPKVNFRSMSVHAITLFVSWTPPACGIRNPIMLKVSSATSDERRATNAERQNPTEIQRDPAKSTKINHIAQRSFFGPSGGKSNAAHPVSILPRCNFELFCDVVVMESFRSAASAVRPLQ